jgi:dsDNA-specific endonuclease/ATPase MutS2
VDDDTPVVFPIGPEIDLHTFRPADVPDLLEEYLRECHERGMTEVRIVHGRGTGQLRATVRAVLGRSPVVVSYADAPPASGGWGATVATLRHDPPAS